MMPDAKLSPEPLPENKTDEYRGTAYATTRMEVGQARDERTKLVESLEAERETIRSEIRRELMLHLESGEAIDGSYLRHLQDLQAREWGLSDKITLALTGKPL